MIGAIQVDRTLVAAGGHGNHFQAHSRTISRRSALEALEGVLPDGVRGMVISVALWYHPGMDDAERRRRAAARRGTAVLTVASLCYVVEDRLCNLSAVSKLPNIYV